MLLIRFPKIAVHRYIRRFFFNTCRQPKKNASNMHRYLGKMYYQVLLLSALLIRKSIHADGSKAGFGAEPQRGVGGAEPLTTKPFTNFIRF